MGSLAARRPSRVANGLVFVAAGSYDSRSVATRDPASAGSPGARQRSRSCRQTGHCVLRPRIIFGVVIAFFIIGAAPAFAWGPATHTKLAGDLLGHLSVLPAAIAALLARHRRDYLFGNIAADMVIAKRLSRIKQFCHHWQTGLTILEDSSTDTGRAFALGYLSHLAADTVAHNKFIPRQMALTKSTLAFGHLYWELRADSTIGPYHWEQLRQVLKGVFAEHEAQLQLQLTDTFLPFSVNWRMFYRLNRFMSRRLWRRAMDRVYGMSRWHLSDQLMREYRSECLQRMIDVVSHPQDAEALHEDPNGNVALAYSRARRRQLRQMARNGLIAPHILYEAAVSHAPMVLPGSHRKLEHL